ncbi:MAG: response regulator, partial [bacterium]
MSESQTGDILLVEDSPADVELAEEVFHEIENFSVTLHVVEDGEKALEYLRNPERDIPDLIILDLDLPRMDGFEVLRELDGDPDLGMVPVIVLTMSNADEDISRAYEFGANACITKPLGF